MLNAIPHPSVEATIVEVDTLTEADRWLILAVLTAGPVELPTDVPDLSPLLDRLATRGPA